MRKFIVPALAALATFGIAPAAHAEEVEVRVDFSDLDLSQETDVNALKSRVLAEVTETCNDEVPTFSSRLLVRSCIRDAMEQADAQIEAQRSLAMGATDEVG